MKCQKCNERKATEIWVGEGDALSYAHGCYQNWCKGCVLDAQIEKDDLAKLLKNERKSMKTKRIGLTKKSDLGPDEACGNCFAILDEEDKFCWECGVELDLENIAYNIQDLKKGNTK